MDDASTMAVAQQLVTLLASDPSYEELMLKLFSKVMGDKLKHVHERLDKVEQRLDEADGHIFDMKTKDDRLEARIREQENMYGTLANKAHHDGVAIAETQQYTRRNCVLITGVPEITHERDLNGKTVPENTDKTVMKLAKEKLGIELREEDLDRTHRATHAKRSDGKPRAIVAKFTRYNTRAKIIQARRELRGSGIGIHDLLTKHKQSLLNDAKEAVKAHPRIKAAWSWDGNITILIDIGGGKDKRFNVNSAMDIKDLVRRYCNL